MKARLVRSLDRLHQRLFGHPMGESMRRFLANLSWSFIGGLIASVVMLSVNILAGRLMGPHEYGRYNLVITWTNILVQVLLLGMDVAVVRSIAMSTTDKDRNRHLSVALWFLLGMVMILVSLAASSQVWPDSWVPDRTILLLVLATGVVFAVKNLVDAIVRGLGWFRFQFTTRIFEVLVLAGAFAFLFFGKAQYTAVAYTSSLIAGSLVVILATLSVLHVRIVPFHLPSFRQQFRLARIQLVGSVMSIVYNSMDKLVIARYLSYAALGVYGAYYTASTNLIAQLSQMFINVFFPSVAQAEDKVGIITKVNRLVAVFVVPLSLVLSGVVWVILSLFGSQYGVRWVFVFGFGTIAAVQAVLTMYASLITAVSRQLFARYLIFLNGIFVLQMLAYGILILLHAVTIEGIMGAILLSVSCTVLLQRRLLTTWQRQQLGA